MNNINRSKATVFFAVALALAAVGSAFLVFALMQEYDSDIGHFATNAMFAPAVYVVCGAAFVLGIVASVLLRKVKPENNAKASLFSCFAHAFAAFLAVAAIVFDRIAAPGIHAEIAAPLLIAYYVFAAGTCAAFLAYAFSASYATNAAKLLSFCPVIYCALQTLILYFDKSVAVNSPIKIICQLAYVSLMLMFVYDSGIAIEKEKTYNKHYACTLWACVISGIASVAAVATQILQIKALEMTLADACLMASLFLVSAVKLHHASFKLIPASEDVA